MSHAQTVPQMSACYGSRNDLANNESCGNRLLSSNQHSQNIFREFQSSVNSPRAFCIINAPQPPMFFAAKEIPMPLVLPTKPLLLVEQGYEYGRS